MTAPLGRLAPTPPPRDEPAALRKVAHELESVFVGQLFQAMRASVPEGLGAPDPGRATFTAMLDDALAREAAQHMERGLGDALYRQLSRRLAAAGPAPQDAAPDMTQEAKGAGHGHGGARD